MIKNLEGDMEEYRKENQNPHYPPYQQYPYAKPNKTTSGKTGLILGIICMALLPFFYNPFLLWVVWVLSIVGLVYSIKGLMIKPRTSAVIGLILSAYPILSHFVLGYPNSLWYVFWLMWHQNNLSRPFASNKPFIYSFLICHGWKFSTIPSIVKCSRL